MKVSDYTKLAVCVLIILAVVVLAYVKVVDGHASELILMGVLGYVFGNGHGVVEANAGKGE